MKKNNTNTIEIKGQLYDASDGGLIKPSLAQTWFSIPVKQDPDDGGQNIKISTHPKHHINKARVRPLKKSQTLMRSSVKKPGTSLKRHLKISANIDHVVNTSQISATEPAVNLISKSSQARSQRAAMLKQSERISHFVAPSDNPISSQTNVISDPPVTAQDYSPLPPPKTSSSLLFEHAMEQANTHVQLPLKLSRSRWRRLALVSIPVTVLVLFVIGANSFTSLQLRVASAKVGFSAALPTYHPAGYNLGQLSYNTGIFASEYHTSNAQRYTITQKTTSWNDQDLLSNYIRVTDPNYHSVQLGSRTIYLYGEGDATWVKGDIWYQVDSNGSLSEAQLINVANSL